LGIVLPRWGWVVLPLAGGVAYSRVYLGVHYPSDVLVGAVWGIAIGWGLTVAARRVLPAEWAIGRAREPQTPACGSDGRGDT